MSDLLRCEAALMDGTPSQCRAPQATNVTTPIRQGTKGASPEFAPQGCLKGSDLERPAMLQGCFHVWNLNHLVCAHASTSPAPILLSLARIQWFPVQVMATSLFG